MQTFDYFSTATLVTSREDNLPHSYWGMKLHRDLSSFPTSKFFGHSRPLHGWQHICYGEKTFARARVIFLILEGFQFAIASSGKLASWIRFIFGFEKWAATITTININTHLAMTTICLSFSSTYTRTEKVRKFHTSAATAGRFMVDNIFVVAKKLSRGPA